MIAMEKPIETDVLVIGGGIGGLMAAINAAEQGARVIIAEKANTRRSGSGSTGNDHFMCYIPEVHGDIETVIKEHFDSMYGRSQDRNLVVKHFRHSFDRVKDWDSWGIPMKVDGKWEFTGHAFPGRPRLHLKYAGAEQKPILTREAEKRGVTIMNKLPITDIITRDGEVIGAIGISIEKKEPRMVVFRAKSVILLTGHANRLYPAITPGWIFNTARCPASTGAGRAAAYRAGARLVNMELPYTHSGPKYFARAGKATWIGVLKDLHGKPVGPFVTKPDKELGDITADVWTSVFTEMNKTGRGPVYMDCTETEDRDLEYMIWGLTNEGNTAMLNYMAREGIDLKKHMVEFTQYEINLRGRGGVEIDENAETNIRGLFAGGDEVGNFNGAISGAATFGWIAGESAAKRAKGMDSFVKAEESELVADRRGFYSEILDREAGPGWKEANLAVNQIMNDYAGLEVRSETLLKSGLKYLGDIREKVCGTIKADDSHSLMRCLEVTELIDIGETIFLAALERKETRGMHKRSDYTFTNPLTDKFITIKLVEGQPIIEWREQIK